MQKILTKTFFSILLLWPIAGHTTPLYPKLFFEYGRPFDLSCPNNPKRAITPQMRDELLRRIPEFQHLWEKESPVLMDTLVGIFGKSFGRQEESIALVLCEIMPPMSHPLVFRIRDYLKTMTSPVKPDFYFVSEVFHEMLHRYIVTNFPYDPSKPLSPLEKKYEKEDGGVRSHIFLLAIQKTIYTKLNRNKELEKIIEWDSGHAPSYKRAWQIVNSEGPEKFIKELKL